ncbi:MAG: DUF1592 domain-containing protein [Pirellulales bacterium]
MSQRQCLCHTKQAILIALLLVVSVRFAPAQDSQLVALWEKHCVECHSASEPAGGLNLTAVNATDVESFTSVLEKIVRRTATGQMPPPERHAMSPEDRRAMLAELTDKLDKHFTAHPQFGRIESFRRLTRTEYKNSVRDLLDLDVAIESLLPADESSHGFDNITVSDLSATLLNRYLTAAEKIARMAVHGSPATGVNETFRMRPDVTQEEQLEGLPLGTRGGMLIPFNFPRSGEYEVQVRLMRDRNEEVEGLSEEHRLHILLDRVLVGEHTVSPPPGRKDFSLVDRNLNSKFTVPAGPHKLGVTFVKNPSSLSESRRRPYQAHFNMHRHPRIGPAVYQVTIVGPIEASEPETVELPSRRRVFIARPASAAEDEACAEKIFAALARSAYRRPISSDDLERPLKTFRQVRQTGSFDDGIEAGLAVILVSPNFLFRIERDPPDVPSGTVVQISDFELASRLSFFLWNSIPDEGLLKSAESGRLSEDAELMRQVDRMLIDPRAMSSAMNFVDQWLHLRNLETITPDLRLFPDFDDNLRQSFRRETELFYADVIQRDLSLMTLIKADYTFLNERLADHYGIPHVSGSRWRRVELEPDSHRGGILRQGSVLTVTSYATRTSPVIRGNWILKNIIGTPPPPPPPNVPALSDNRIAASLPIRERLAQHRQDAACAVCHNLMDPVGFSLENYDAVGRWREKDGDNPVDSVGSLPDGRQLNGADALQQALVDSPEPFVSAFTEKMMTYALGRGLDHHDAPSVRRIVRDAGDAGFRSSTIVKGIVRSAAFQRRSTP